jgi:hypothetical protein
MPASKLRLVLAELLEAVGNIQPYNKTLFSPCGLLATLFVIGHWY